MSRTIRESRVAVVGGAGFLGSHLVAHLVLDRACKVTVIDNLVAGRRDFVHPRASFVHHDVTGSEEYLRDVFERDRVEYVFNYAAYPYVPDGYDRPLRVCDVNFFGAMKVVNAAQAAGARGILQVSSAEVYGDGTESSAAEGMDESVPVRPKSSYGASKAAVDFWCQARWREARTPVVVLRQFNCIGERETHPYVLTEIISQVQRHLESGKTSGVTPIRLGNNTRRDFMYAGDAVEAAVKLLECGDFGEVYNLGSGTSMEVYHLAPMVCVAMGAPEAVFGLVDPAKVRHWELWCLRSNNGKVRSAVGPVTRTDTMDAVRRAVRWYRDAARSRWPWESPS